MTGAQRESSYSSTHLCIHLYEISDEQLTLPSAGGSSDRQPPSAFSVCKHYSYDSVSADGCVRV